MKTKINLSRMRGKKYSYFKRPEFIASILMIAWAFALSTYAFTSPPAGCSPGSCANPLTVDFENQTVSVASAPTASGNVATKAYVDATVWASGGDGRYFNDSDGDFVEGIYEENGDLVLNITNPAIRKDHDCDDADANIIFPNDGTCDGDGDTYFDSTSANVTTSGFDIDDSSATVVQNNASILYTPGTLVTGNLGGRSWIDSLCTANKPTKLSCGTIHGFISVNASDEIRDMRLNYGYVSGDPIYGYNSSTVKFTKIVDNWDDLLDWSIDTLLSWAMNFSGNWWSGSESNGSLNGNTCAGWTSAGTDGGQIGQNYVNYQWISVGSNFCYNTNLVYLCICKPN